MYLDLHLLGSKLSLCPMAFFASPDEIFYSTNRPYPLACTLIFLPLDRTSYLILFGNGKGEIAVYTSRSSLLISCFRKYGQKTQASAELFVQLDVNIFKSFASSDSNKFPEYFHSTQNLGTAYRESE